jgi:hypothetical protein
MGHQYKRDPHTRGDSIYTQLEPQSAVGWSPATNLHDRHKVGKLFASYVATVTCSFEAKQNFLPRYVRRLCRTHHSTYQLTFTSGAVNCDSESVRINMVGK